MTSKCKILFVAHRMDLGGIEKSLLALLEMLPDDKFEKHLALTETGGALFGAIPSNVTVHIIEPFARNMQAFKHPAKGILQELKTGHIVGALRTSASIVRSYAKHSRIPYYARFLADGPLIDEQFDIAVSYPGPTEMHDEFVAHWVKARRKMAWIHFDIDYVFHRPATILSAARQYERIFIVDESSKAVYDRHFPSLASKTRVFHNLVNRRDLLAKASESTPEPLPDGVKRIVTVGRVCHPKGQDIAVDVAAELRRRGLRFVWHIIGTGVCFDEYSALPAARGLDDCIRFEGAMLNPAPYLAAADVYVQPSRHEGYCIAVAEARQFGMPIVATDFSGSGQLKGYPHAHVTEHSVEALAGAIEKAMTEPRVDTASLSGNDHELQSLITYFING